MTLKEKYLQCKDLAQKINKYLDQGFIVIDNDSEVVTGRFVFNDKMCYIAIKRKGGSTPFCGHSLSCIDKGELIKWAWGKPRVSDFKKLKICKEFFKL